MAESGGKRPVKNDYKGFGVDTDTAMTVTDLGRTASGFIPGGRMVQGGLDVTLAAVQGDIESTKEEHRLSNAGINVKHENAKWNPRIRGHMDKLKGRWKGRAGEAIVSTGGAAAGGAAAVGLASALGIAGGVAIPVIGAPIGAAIGTVVGGAAGGFMASKAYNAVVPFDEKDEVDITIKISEAQKNGQEVPAEAIFAQWAAAQKGPMDKNLKNDLKAATGLTNFNDAIEQGKLDDITKMMKKPQYAAAMRADLGIMEDANDPDRSAADQVAEWVNSGNLEGKDLLLGKSHMPIMSLADAEKAGYTSDPLLAPTLDMAVRKQRSPEYVLSA